MASTEFSFRPICRTQERLDSTPSRSLCRQLFGPIDHSQTQTDLKRELAKMNQEATLKWNFDFENDKPLEGNYLWRRIRSKESSTKASSSSVCCKTEESNSSRDVVASVESEANTNTDISSTKPELVFSDNDKQITAKRSGKKRPSSQKISGNFKCSFFFWYCGLK